MNKSTLVLVAITLVSAVGLAKPLAKMEAVCVANESQDTIRTVYITADKTPLMADPLSHLLIVDTVQQPVDGSVVLIAASEEGSETLTVKNTGEATLTATTKSATTNFTMKCYTNGVMHGLNFN